MTEPNDDERLAVDLNVGGGDAVQKAKAMLSGYDIDDEDVTRISIQVFERDEPADVDENPGGQTSKNGSQKRRSKLTEDDRSLKGVQAGSSYHLVLVALDQADADDVAPDELADVLGVTPNAVSTVLSKLYQRRLADRETGQKPYRYWITDHGVAELDDIGRDVTADDVGGVWTDD